MHLTHVSKLALLAFVIIILAFSAFGLRQILGGPQLTLVQPTTTTATTSNATVVLIADTRNVTQADINGLPVFPDPQGQISTRLYPAVGLNTYHLTIADRYQNKKTIPLQIIRIKKAK